MRQRNIYTQVSLISVRKAIVFTLAFVSSFYLSGQAPTWVYSGDFVNTMTIVMTVSDECVPSADANDIIAAFDINGEVRGVAQTNIGTKAYITVGGAFTGELISFKVYDDGTGEVYNIHNFTIPFQSGQLPNDTLIFDSSSDNMSGGPDQDLYDVSSTTLEASGVGMWSIISGAGGSFVNASSPTTQFNGVLGTSYLLAWTLSDTQGCIGETDEVSISFIISVPETTLALCTDGIDNDNDGMVDCADSDCAKPRNISFQNTEPTPIDCSTTNSDGSIVIIQTGGDLFSLDGGATQMGTTFSGLGTGTYDVWIQNTTTSCTTTVSTSLENISDDLDISVDLDVSGPTVYCNGLSGIEYGVTGVPSGKTVAWSMDGGIGHSLMPSVNTGRVTFGTTGTEVKVIATVAGNCRNVSDTLSVIPANPTICTNFSNCVQNIHVSNDLVLSSGIQMFHAREGLTADIMFIKDNYQLTAGTAIELQPGFSIAQGVSVLAEIRSCPSIINP